MLDPEGLEACDGSHLHVHLAGRQLIQGTVLAAPLLVQWAGLPIIVELALKSNQKEEV